MFQPYTCKLDEPVSSQVKHKDVSQMITASKCLPVCAEGNMKKAYGTTLKGERTRSGMCDVYHKTATKYMSKLLTCTFKIISGVDYTVQDPHLIDFNNIYINKLEMFNCQTMAQDKRLL